jgi:hypothetical protein
MRALTLMPAQILTMEVVMAMVEWGAILVGLLVSADLLCAKYRDWHARRVAIKSERTFTAKYVLFPRRKGACS